MIDNRMKSVRKAKDIWYAWYPSDYASKTAHLSLLEHGAYRVLLDHYYQVDGKVVANATPLLRVCRAFDAAEQAAVKAVLLEFFLERDGYYRHERADAELEKRRELKAKRAAAGSKGGSQKALASAVANAKQKPPHLHLHLQNKEDSEAKASEPTGSPAPVIELIVPKKEPEPEPPKPVLVATPMDLEAQVWAVGKAYLEGHGVSRQQAGALIGKWRKLLGYDDLEVIRTLRRAQSECVVDPIPFIEKCISSRKGNSNGRSTRQYGPARNGSDHSLGGFAQLKAELGEIPGGDGLPDNGLATH